MRFRFGRGGAKTGTTAGAAGAAVTTGTPGGASGVTPGESGAATAGTVGGAGATTPAASGTTTPAASGAATAAASGATAGTVARALFATFAIMIFALLGTTGCSADTPTDSTGGISNTADEEAANINQVNTMQLPDSSFLYDAQIADLQNSDLYLNGQIVQVTGEVVGDRIVSDYDSNFYWITLQATDGSYAEISVHMPKSSTEMIDMYGAYGKRGTILQVRGTFWTARADREGVTELEAQNVSVVKRGEIMAAQAEPMRFIAGGILLIIGAGLALLYWHLGESRR